MRVILLSILMCVSISFPQQQKQYVITKKGMVEVYKNQSHKDKETPVFSVGKDDVLVVLESDKDSYKVQDSSKRTGWIEKKSVITLEKSKAFRFDNVEVMGYLENPTPVYIIDGDNPDAEKIILCRSFRDALRDNIDKETSERQSGN